jgi:hypothetical protein
MKTIRNLVTIAAIAMMVAAFGSSRAKAQGLVHGSFNLPFPAQWGSATLPIGDYSFSILQTDGHNVFVRIWGESTGTASALIMGYQGEAGVAEVPNSMTCISVGSACYVQTLNLSALGETLRFAVPKGVVIEAGKRSREKQTMRAQGLRTVRVVPVTIS